MIRGVDGFTACVNVLLVEVEKEKTTIGTTKTFCRMKMYELMLVRMKKDKKKAKTCLSQSMKIVTSQQSPLSCSAWGEQIIEICTCIMDTISVRHLLDMACC